MRVGIVIILIFISGRLFSQMSYREIDSTSYAMYLQSNWKGLKDLAEKEPDHSYHYLDIRYGVAYYYLAEYKTASEYLEKALSQSYNETAQEFLYYSFYYLGYIKEAEEAFEKLSKETKKRIDRDPLNMNTFIYAEGGLKLSADTSVAKNLSYFGFKWDVHTSRTNNFQGAFSRAEQKTNWGWFDQNEYAIQWNVQMKKGWTISSNLSAYNYSSGLSFYAGDTIVGLPFQNGAFTVDSSAILSTRYIGSLDQVSNFMGSGVKRWFGNTLFQAQVHNYNSVNTNNYYQILGGEYTYNVSSGGFTNTAEINRFDTTLVDSQTTINQTQIAASLKYGFQSKKWLIQPEFQLSYHIADTNRIVLVPSLSINSERFGLNINYISKKEQVLFLMNDNNLINTRNDIQYRLGITSRFQLNKKIDIYLITQIDRQRDFFSLQSYKTYSIFTGLNFRL